MIGEHLDFPLPFTAASALRPYQPVKVAATGVRKVVPVSADTDEIQGFIGGASAGIDVGVTVYGENSVVEAVAAASVGPGADVGVASTNGALGPAASGSFRVGRSFEGAAAGEHFSIYVKPGKVG